MPKPIPVPDELSKPFWDACNEKRLVLQNCESCDKLQYPPKPRCGNCGSSDSLNWKEVEGKGHVLEYAIMRDTRIKPLQADQPFNFVVISLDQDPGINFLSNLPGTPVGEVPVGSPVELVFEDTGSGQLIHEWKVKS